jgi:hypothetical protein
MNCFHLPNKASGSSGSIERFVACSTAEKNKLFLGSELLYECIVYAPEAVCPENKIAFENIILSRTTVHSVEEINSDLGTQMIRSHLRILLCNAGWQSWHERHSSIVFYTRCQRLVWCRYWITFHGSYILSRVYGSVTNNSGFWIGWLDSSTASSTISLNHNQSSAEIFFLDPLHSRPRSTTDFCQSQSKSYFTTGGLPPISSSWRQAPWDPRSEFFFQLNSCGNSPYATSCLTKHVGCCGIDTCPRDNGWSRWIQQTNRSRGCSVSDPHHVIKWSSFGSSVSRTGVVSRSQS